MTKARRFLNIITGLIMMAVGAGLFLYPATGLLVIVGIMSAAITLRGIQSLWYYLTMARFMVGGKFSLYLGIFYLDIGLLTTTVIKYPAIILIVYIAGLQGFSGVIDVLKSLDTRRIGAGGWLFQLFYGVTEIGLALAVIIFGLFLHSAYLAVYIYSLGMVYSGILRAVSAFRKTPIVYIQ